MKQRGIAPLFILLTLAVIFVVGALVYSSFFAKKKPEIPEDQISPSRVSSGTAYPLSGSSQTNPANCSDTDYTGCDTSSDFMTWKDDGIRSPENDSSDLPPKYK